LPDAYARLTVAGWQFTASAASSTVSSRCPGGRLADCGQHVAESVKPTHTRAVPSIRRSQPAFVIDPVVVDEAPARVQITGVKAVRRRVISHALNQIASARPLAQESETFYEKVNAIVCHMGGGISVGAHRRGRCIDANNALDGEGPFSPERSGSLPQVQLAELCFAGACTHAEIERLVKGAGGLVDLLGTSDRREVERRSGSGRGL